MMRVKEINKDGNKIISYTCEQDDKTFDLTKEQLIDKINNKEVENARIQVYKGNTIIRVNIESDNKKHRNSKNKSNENKNNSDKITSKELMVQIAKEFNVNNINGYMKRFFEKNTNLEDKVYTLDNISEKARDMKIMLKFWVLVANKQMNETIMSLQEQISDIEYQAYCIENNIMEDEEQ